MKKFLILLVALFCLTSCATFYKASSPIVYVKVFQRLTPHTALCYQVHYSAYYEGYVRSDKDVIKLETSKFVLYDYGVYKLNANNIMVGSTYTYETESGKLRTVPVWEYYY